jgi:hypothetical protein
MNEDATRLDSERGRGRVTFIGKSKGYQLPYAVCLLNPWEVTLVERPQPPILFCLRNVSHKIHPS